MGPRPGMRRRIRKAIRRQRREVIPLPVEPPPQPGLAEVCIIAAAALLLGILAGAWWMG